MPFIWNVDGPEWQVVPADIAAADIRIVDDAGGLLDGAALEAIRDQIRRGEVVVVVNSWGHAQIGPEAEITELIARHERRGFWDGGENQ